jgi:hypothetical protein
MLRFDYPSNIHRLIFEPPESLISVEIPDSVERVRCSIVLTSTRHFALNFSSKSNLREIRFQEPKGHVFYGTDRKPRLFVRVSESMLKEFRSTLELYDGRIPNSRDCKSVICMLIPGSNKLDVEE